MPKPIQLRPVTEGEKTILERLSRSRTAQQRHVARAQIILGWLSEQRPEAIAQAVGCHVTTVY